MLGVNQLDFINYTTALKGNYRKGCHKLQAILSTTVHATEFAKNKGGVAVVLGVPVDSPDKNSDTLLALLFASSVADLAVETFLGCYYTFDSLDDLLADEDTCLAITDDPLQWRAANGSSIVPGKLVATLAGLNCSEYTDMDDVASSSTAMAALTASDTAMDAICASSMAVAKYAAGASGLDPEDYSDMDDIASSSTAMAAIIDSPDALDAVVSSSTAMTAVAASSTAMAAVTESPVAMAAIWESDTAIQAVEDNAAAWSTFTGASSEVMGKTVAILADLDPADYDDMDDIASSSTAMTAVASSSTAMTAVVASSTARLALYNSYSITAPAIASSSVALASIRASNRCVTSDMTRVATKSFNVYSDKAFILTHTIGYSMEVTFNATLGGNVTVGSGTGEHNVMKFASAVKGTSSYTGSSTADGNIVEYLKI